MGLSVLVGLVASLFGVGGGVVIVTALVLLLRYGLRRASGTSLPAIIPTATVDVISYASSGDVSWIPALIVAVSVVIGAPGGSLLPPRIPVTTLQLTVAVFMLAVMVIVSLFLVIQSRGDHFELTFFNSILLGVLGIVTGVLCGLLGVGGGIIESPL